MGVRTNIQRVFDAFTILQTYSFGGWKSKNIFVLHSDLCDRIAKNEIMHNILTQLGVSLSMLQGAMIKKDSILPPAKKKKIMNNENTLPELSTSVSVNKSGTDTMYMNNSISLPGSSIGRNLVNQNFIPCNSSMFDVDNNVSQLNDINVDNILSLIK